MLDIGVQTLKVILMYYKIGNETQLQKETLKLIYAVYSFLMSKFLYFKIHLIGG